MKLKALSQFLILLLLADALWVFIGLAQQHNMWLSICMYWAILTIKNLVDFLAGTKRGKNDA